MKQVDFYLISNRVKNAHYKLASRLANKLQRLDHHCLVITQSREDTDSMTEIMWSFSDSSFLAHDNLGDSDFVSKVQIGDAHSVTPSVLEKPYDVLINLAADVPVFSHHFSRIAEIVDVSDEAKAAARSRYKHYQSEGFSLKTHDIEL